MVQHVELSGTRIKVVVNEDLSITVLKQDGQSVWESSRAVTPVAVVRHGEREPCTVPLAKCADTSVSAFTDGAYRGHKVRLAGICGTDAIVEVSFGLDAGTDELMCQVEQVGGEDVVVSVEHVYRFEKPVGEGGYIVLPHGSGYLIPADCSDEMPGEGFVGGRIGGRWTLPLFGMVKGSESLVAIADTWWDCEVYADHVPGELSALDFNWSASLGRLSYARRIRYRFAEDMDYLGMAKLYRREAAEEGLVRTLAEKMAETPQIERYLEGMLVRWPAWNPALAPEVLEHTKKLTELGFKVNFFFPKWPAMGYSEDKNTANSANALWQAFLHPNPVPGGWPALVDFNEKLKELGCLTQGFVCPISQEEGAPQFDLGRAPIDSDGKRHEVSWSPDAVVSSAYFVENQQAVLGSLKEYGLHFDVLYHDGFTAHGNLPEDFTPEHPREYRHAFEAQNECFADVRAAGIMPGGELVRFWAMHDCDYGFYTDWSADRLSSDENQHCSGPVGEPIPLFQLVFHDCYMAGFSGGGYVLYTPGYDWWLDLSPRLYELLFVAMPCHNWLPGGTFPYENFDSPEAEARWEWLRKMSALCQATKFSEMTSHRFVSEDRKRHRIEFANGVIAELDMAANRYRIQGADGFTGDWETPPEDL